MRAIRGNIIEAKSLGKLDILPNGCIITNDDGTTVETLPALPLGFAGEIDDYKDALVMQSFCDMHSHAPQYPNLGMGYDLQLLDWLAAYTFPIELRFADTEYARKVYKRLARELVDNGTTRVSMFSSPHVDSTLILMEELENAGITGFVGKVNMDTNPNCRLVETTEESKRETLRWLDSCGDFKNIRPMLTPRFTPSCSMELLEWLGKLARERGLYVQSHLSENRVEQALVLSLQPGITHYYQSYDRFGLFGDHTLMAHCVYCDDEELEAIRRNNVYAVHCADSNISIVSGLSPVRKMLDMGIHVVLGSDIAGGTSLSMIRAARNAIYTSKVINVQSEYTTPFLTVAEAYYLATGAGAEYFGSKSGFAKGEKLHAIIVDDTALFGTDKLSVRDRFGRCFYMCDDRQIKAVYGNGKRLK